LVVSFLCAAFAAGAAEDERVQQSRAHFRAGTAFYDEGHYDRAIKEYEEAYRLLPLPEFLFDLGQASRLKGNRELAMRYYRQYLAKQPASRFSEEARNRLRELEAESAPTAAPETGAQTNAANAANAANPANAANASARKPPKPWFKSIAGWALVGGGVALEGVGIGLFVNANSLDAQIPNAPSLMRATQLQQERDAYRTGGAVVCAVGGAALVAGVVVLGVSAYRGRHAR
jgi:tetratricopeptide (TPR) repeat protein